MIDSTNQKAIYKAERLIISNGCLNKAYEHQKNVVISLEVGEFKHNLNTKTLKVLKMFKKEVELIKIELTKNK